MAELVEISFGLWTRVGLGKHAVDGGPDLPCKGAIFRRKNTSWRADDSL